MAIQHRRGIYDRFDPTRLVAGEWAVVLSNDPNARDGMAAYICFAAGTVKRVATFEDMQDNFLSIRDETVDWIVNTANAGFKAEYEAIRDDAKQAEAERVANELRRVGNEASRESAEARRIEAEELRRAAEEGRVLVIRDFEGKVAAGYFHGATFVPSVSDAGVLSWSNDKGLPNPVSIDVRGPKGNDGVVTELAAGMFALQIEGTHLYLVHGDNSAPPNMEISEGHLWLEVEG